MYYVFEYVVCMNTYAYQPIGYCSILKSVRIHIRIHKFTAVCSTGIRILAEDNNYDTYLLHPNHLQNPMREWGIERNASIKTTITSCNKINFEISVVVSNGSESSERFEKKVIPVSEYKHR